MILVYLLGNISSQALSRVYNLINGNEYGTEIFVGDKGYFVLTNGICDSGTGDSKACTSMISLNKSGDVINQFIFKNRLRFCANTPIQVINDTIYIFGYNEFIVPWDWIIYKTNMNGDSLGKITYNNFSEAKVAGRGIANKEEFLYLGGQTWDTGETKLQIVVVKMDKQGKVVKEERFLNVTKSKFHYQMHDIVALDDGNFVLLYTYIIESGRIPGIIKFDENLNYIWHREFNHNDSYLRFPGITALDKGDVLFNWEVYTPYLIDELGEEYKKYGRYPKTLYRIDKDGNTVWADTMWTLISENSPVAPRGDIYMMEQTKDGDIIGAGKYRKYESLPINNWAWIFKYSKEGELLWEKIYEDQNINENYSKFYDIMEALNGDIVCTGQMTDDDVWGGNADYTWVLRVDSNGCFEPGCGVADSVQLVYTYSDLVTGIDELVSDYSYHNGVIIYPNPASAEINVELAGENNNALKWNVFNIQGSKILSGTGNNILNIDISILEAGLYYVRVMDNKGKLRVGKFVVK